VSSPSTPKGCHCHVLTGRRVSPGQRESIASALEKQENKAYQKLSFYDLNKVKVLKSLEVLNGL